MKRAKIQEPKYTHKVSYKLKVTDPFTREVTINVNNVYLKADEKDLPKLIAKYRRSLQSGIELIGEPVITILKNNLPVNREGIRLH